MSIQAPQDGPVPPDRQETDEPGREPARRPRPRALGCLFEIVETLVLTLVVFFVIQTFVAQPYRVVGPSMEHTFVGGQYVLVDKLSPRVTGYHRGDVIVFNPPPGYEQEGKEPFIKRILGLPGDTVEIRDGKVYVNGAALDEPYIYDGQQTLPAGLEPPWVVPADNYLVMGDHRGASEDSRVFGFVKSGWIIGRAWLRYWPLSALGIVPAPSYGPIPTPAAPAPPAAALPAASATP